MYERLTTVNICCMEDLKEEIDSEVLSQFPDSESEMYPVFIGFRGSHEQKAKLEYLKAKGKDRSKVLRAALDLYLAKVPIKDIPA